jgi:acetylglutamate kinase
MSGIFAQRTAVVKVSGKAVDRLTTDGRPFLDYLRRQFPHIAIVHGGGNRITQWCDDLAVPTRFVDGRRVTTPEVLQVVLAVQSGLINTTLVNALCAANLPAVGLTPASCGLGSVQASEKSLGLVGIPVIDRIPIWIVELMGSHVPVFATVGRDASGLLRNVNADPFAAELARAIGADAVFFVSDTPGIIMQGRVQPELRTNELVSAIASGQAIDGMIPKIEACMRIAETSTVWVGSVDTANAAFAHGETNAGTRILRGEEVHV